MSRDCVLEIDTFFEVFENQGGSAGSVWFQRPDGVVEIPSTVAFFNKLASLLCTTFLEEDEPLSSEARLVVAVIVLAFADLIMQNNSKKNDNYYSACRFLLNVDGVLQTYCDLLKIDREPLQKLAKDIILGKYVYKRRAKSCASDYQNQLTS